jgi:hypothetical protein
MSDQPASGGTPAAGEATPSAPPAPDPASTSTLGDLVRWLVVGACVGSAVIHFAYAPTHMDEDAVHGAFFLGVAWAQLGAAFALARWREPRWPWGAAAALNAAVVGV